MHSSWNESNLDVAYKTALGEKVDMLVSANYYNYDNPIDKNGGRFYGSYHTEPRIIVFKNAFEKEIE